MRLYPALCIGIGVFLDQITKNWARTSAITKVTSFFSLTKTWNPGIGWGLLPCTTTVGTYILIGVELGLFALLQIWYMRSKAHYEKIGILFVMSGALGNLLDRLIFGAVFDFLDVHWGRWHFPAFNVADIFISMGFLILMKESLWPGHDRSP